MTTIKVMVASRSLRSSSLMASRESLNSNLCGAVSDKENTACGVTSYEKSAGPIVTSCSETLMTMPVNIPLNLKDSNCKRTVERSSSHFLTTLNASSSEDSMETLQSLCFGRKFVEALKRLPTRTAVPDDILRACHLTYVDRVGDRSEE